MRQLARGALRLVRSAFRFVRDLVRPRAHLAAENEFLRQQLAVVRRQVNRARPTDTERGLLAFFARLFPWRDRGALHLVTPETLIRWHRKGWRLYWTWKSRRRNPRRGGRPRIPEEVRELIRDMARRNSQGRRWGVKRILGELEKLGISVSRRTVQKILREVRPRGPRGDQRWTTFLRNHFGSTWACDFFTVPTLLFRQLHVFFFMRLDTREILHWNVTEHPTDAWTAQQLRNALFDRDPPRFLLRDRDTKYGGLFDRVLEGATETLLTPPRCPQANSLAERFVGSVRQECLDHMIPRNEEHLRRSLSTWLAYYHTARPHQGLNQQIPAEVHDPVDRPKAGPIKTREVLGGLYHVYYRDTAA